MSEEPKHRDSGIPASEFIASYPLYLPHDEGVVGLWKIVIDGRRGFGLAGAELADYVRRALAVLMEAGARPLKEIDGKEYYFVPQPQYGSTEAEITDAVMAEWLKAGGKDGDPSGLWFGLPKLCDRRERRDGLQRMLDYLDFFEEKGIHFFIERTAPDELMATLTLVGVRVEVSFQVDDMTFSVFRGNEDVIPEVKSLFDLIDENWGDD